MIDQELFELSKILNYEDFSKLFDFWLKQNAKSLSFDNAKYLLWRCIEIITETKEYEITQHKEHAMYAEMAGGIALQRCNDIKILTEAATFIDNFKHKSFCNYGEWFYKKLEKIKMHKADKRK